MPWWAWLLVGWSLIAPLSVLWLGGAARLIERAEQLEPEWATVWEPPDLGHRAVGWPLSGP